MSPEIVVELALMSLAERKKYPAANRRTSVLPPEGMTTGTCPGRPTAKNRRQGEIGITDSGFDLEGEAR